MATSRHACESVAHRRAAGERGWKTTLTMRTVLAPVPAADLSAGCAIGSREVAEIVNIGNAGHIITLELHFLGLALLFACCFCSLIHHQVWRHIYSRNGGVCFTCVANDIASETRNIHGIGVVFAPKKPTCTKSLTCTVRFTLFLLLGRVRQWAWNRRGMFESGRR